MVNFNVPIFNRLKILGLLYANHKFIYIIAVFKLTLHKYNVYIKYQVLHYVINVKRVKKFMLT